MTRFRRWLAQKLRAFVERHDPITIVGTPAIAPGPGQSRFRVLRTVNGHDAVLYDGPSGAQARRWWEHVQSHRERGQMTFWQDDICRGTYTHPTE